MMSLMTKYKAWAGIQEGHDNPESINAFYVAYEMWDMTIHMTKTDEAERC